ncbi:hypothetical protein HPP92_017492 [Vanilla planifolia]|uniref:Uncharacterized protein n=1 Tax=Vanilla planifolia TaxID=51239 RepID=A0A835QKZ9_VANPL|nr:hypothetical protein HPP92_017492 [Vanilla planifolia]
MAMLVRTEHKIFEMYISGKDKLGKPSSKVADQSQRIKQAEASIELRTVEQALGTQILESKKKNACSGKTAVASAYAIIT